MSSAPEEFEQLQKLLRLKRHERPPPGYFNDFSSRVIASIEDKSGQTTAERIWAEAPWLQRFFHFLEVNPFAAGGFAVAICSLLLGGIVYSEYDETGSANFAGASEPGTMMAFSSRPLMVNNPVASNSLSASSTSAVISGGLQGSPFDTMSSLSVQPVSYTVGGH